MFLEIKVTLTKDQFSYLDLGTAELHIDAKFLSGLDLGVITTTLLKEAADLAEAKEQESLAAKAADEDVETPVDSVQPTLPAIPF